MRKLPAKYENPVDNLFICAVDRVMPIFKCFNLTPNHLTFLSLIFGLISIYYLHSYEKEYFTIFFLIAYFFDVADGHYARSYKLTSKFGDYFDHIKDIIVSLLSMYVVCKRYDVSWSIAIIFIICILLMNIHLGCQEKIYTKASTDTLTILRSLCPGDPERSIKVSKYFGSGSTQIFAIIILYFLQQKKI
jgi:phosphatidylglycerophosphate synthase